MLLLIAVVIAAAAWVDACAGRAVVAQGSWVAVRPPAAPAQLVVIGVLQGQTQAEVLAPFEAPILAVLKPLGSEVGANDALLQLDTAALQAQLLEVRAAALKSELALRDARGWQSSATANAGRRQIAGDERQLGDAQRKHADTERLYDQGIVSRDEFDQSRQAVEAAIAALANSREAQLQQAAKGGATEVAEIEAATQRARVQLLERKLARSVVRAPIAGVLTYVGVEAQNSQSVASPVGIKLTEGALAARVVDKSRLQVAGAVSETAVGQLRVGQKAVVQPLSQPGTSIDGRVSRISALPLDNNVIDMNDERRNVRFQVVIELSAAPDGRVPPLGTNAEARIDLAQQDGDAARGLLVDLAAVQPAGDGIGKLRVRRAGGPPRELTARLGRTAEDGVHVLDASLAAGDEVYVPNPAASVPVAAEAAPSDGSGLRGMLRKVFGGGA